MSSHQKRKQIVSFRSALILAAFIVLLTMANAVLLQDNPELRTITGDLITPSANFLATLGLIYGAYYSGNDKNIRTAWTVLAIAQLSYTIGDIIWSTIEVGMNQPVPFPSLADWPYLMFYPLFATGILLLPKVPLTSGEKLKVLLDTGIVMIASVILFWVLLIAPTIESNAQSDTLTATLSVAYPVMDLVLLFALIELLFRRIESVRLVPILLLVASSIMMIATDFFFMRQSLQGTYISGGMLDTGWTVAYALNGLAGVSHANSKQIDLAEVTKPVTVQFTWPLYIPYLCAGATYILLIWSYDHPMPVSFFFLSWAVGGIIGLVIVRQIVALDENAKLYEKTVQENAERKRAEEEVRSLNEKLETRVVERTSQFESANKELTIEIQERKKAEEALNSARDQLLAIIEFLPDATYVVDRNKKVIAWNQAMEEMTGVGKQDMLGKGDYAYSIPFYGEPRPLLIDLIDKPEEEVKLRYSNIVRTGRAINAESFIPSLLKSKETYLWGTASLLYDSEGNLVGSIESIRDITDRKQSEEVVRKARDDLELRVKERTAELEAKNAEMERFIYTVSHDLRSPLVTIQGFNGFLRGDIEKGDNERVITDLRLIEEAVTKMDRLLSETLELSRVGRVANPPEDVPFAEIVQESLLQISQRIKSKGIEVSVASNLPIVHVDRMRIVEVLINLIENSMKCMDDSRIVE